MTNTNDRRPIGARNFKPIHALARSLSGVNPNLISAASMIFAAVAADRMYGFGLAHEAGEAKPYLLLLAALFIQMRLLCNLLDGLVAVEYGTSRPTGSLWNEIPDRPADVIIFAGAGLAIGSLATGLALGMMALFIAYLRAFGASLGAGQIWNGPMSKPYRMHLLSVGLLLAGFGFTNALPIAMGAIAFLGVYTIINRLKKISNHVKENGS